MFCIITAVSCLSTCILGDLKILEQQQKIKKPSVTVGRIFPWVSKGTNTLEYNNFGVIVLQIPRLELTFTNVQCNN